MWSEFNKFLSVLRSLPPWVLVGLALAAYAVLYVPPFGNIDPKPFREQWGVWFWAGAIIFSVLSCIRIIEAGLTNYWTQKKSANIRRVLRFVPLHWQRRWHLVKQQDDSFTSQIALNVQVTNTSDIPVQIVKVRLIKPKAKILTAFATLPMKGSPYHSHKHPVPPHGTVTSAIHIMARGKLANKGRPIFVTLGITDQYGEEYKIKKIIIETRDQPSDKGTLLSLFYYLKILLSRLLGRELEDADKQALINPWTYEPGKEYIDISEAILNEEKRNYAACGRIRGGLGSLNVGLQSEPNYGWTEVGKVPQLLWNKEDGRHVSSPNMERLLRTYETLNDPDKDNLKRYLLSQLYKESFFAEVAYFIFLALHRMEVTIDALRTARTFLKGDKVFGYSNLLGTLSAIVSHEHFAMALCVNVDETPPL